MSRYKQIWPRLGEPWTEEEDARLLALHDQGVSFSGYGPAPARLASRHFQRTACGVEARLRALLLSRRRQSVLLRSEHERQLVELALVAERLGEENRRLREEVRAAWESRDFWLGKSTELRFGAPVSLQLHNLTEKQKERLREIFAEVKAERDVSK